MKFRIVTNNKGKYSIERTSICREETARGFFFDSKYKWVERWIACADLSSQSNLSLKAEWIGPHIMNLVRKEYDSYESAKQHLDNYLQSKEVDIWSQVGEVIEAN